LSRGKANCALQLMKLWRIFKGKNEKPKSIGGKSSVSTEIIDEYAVVRKFRTTASETIHVKTAERLDTNYE